VPLSHKHGRMALLSLTGLLVSIYACPGPDSLTRVPFDGDGCSWLGLAGWPWLALAAHGWPWLAGWAGWADEGLAGLAGLVGLAGLTGLAGNYEAPKKQWGGLVGSRGLS
jgi:hypothetical protein